MTHDEMLTYYTQPGLFTGLDGFESDIDGLPVRIPLIVGARST